MCVIGVHVRRGDYKTWADGKYFFSDEVYEKYMDNLEQKIKQANGKRVKFIVFSNENISFKESDRILISLNEWYVDQYLMSICDYLVGPPSTFSAWASYVGSVKYFHIVDSSGVVELNDFLSCEG